MALKLAEDFKGIRAEYWRINTIKYDDITDIIRVYLALYVDEAARTASLLNNVLKEDKMSIIGIKTVLTPAELKDVANSIDLLKSVLYIKIKEMDKFLTATDC